MRNPYSRSLLFGAFVCLLIGLLMLVPHILLPIPVGPPRQMILREGDPNPYVLPAWWWGTLFFGSGFTVLGFAQLTCWQVVNALRWREPHPPTSS